MCGGDAALCQITLTTCCNVLPTPYLIHQRRLISWYKIRNSENVVLQTLSSLKHNLFIATGSKYDICSYDALVKCAVWNTFATSVNADFM